MNTAAAVTLALAAGIGIGAVGIGRLRAQPKPPVFMIAEVEVRDAEGYAREYVPLAERTLKEHGGRYIAAGKPTPVDGEAPQRAVVVQWESMEKLLGWRHSPAYEKARAIGEKYATYRDFALEGVAR
jgi:uncharacterized protein (DUF1330 family)